MLLQRIFLVGVCACFMLPVWADKLPSTQEISLSISTTSVQKMDSSLPLFIEKVWAESPVVKAAQSAIKAALAREEGTDQPLYNPNLVLDAESSEINTAVIGFNQTLDWSDQRDAQRQMAHKQVLMAQAELRQVKQKVAVETLSALAEYVTAQQMQALGLQRGELIQNFIDMVKKRQLAGDMGALEGMLAQVTYSEVLMQQAAIDSQLAEAEAALQSVTGLVLKQWPSLPSELASPPENVQYELLKKLPELSVLIRRMEAAKSRVLVMDRATSMAPTIGVRAGQEGSETLVGVSLEIPLFVRNDFKAEVRALSYEVVMEEQAYQAAYRRAKARFDGSLGRYKNTSRAWNVWLTQGQTAHREQIVLLERIWQASELTATDYLIQAKQSIETEKAAMVLMGEVWQAVIAWLNASGQVADWLGISPIESKNVTRFGE